MNGKQIASSTQMAGAWRLFEYDVTAAAKPGEANALAIEVFPPQPRDLAITFVDWNPLPPDKDMGLWRDVYLSATGPAAIRYPAVFTRLNSPANDLAALTVRCEVRNAAARAMDGVLRGRIEGVEFSQAGEAGGARDARDPFQRRNSSRSSRSPSRACGGRRRWARRICIRWN